MTDAEFPTFARRLFVSFPALHDWLQTASPDPAETQAIWREALRPCSLAECLGIIDDWNTGKSKPFEAYERDKVHLIIKSMVGLQRDRQRKRDENAGRSKDYSQLPNTPYTDATMASVYLKLRPLHKKVLDGEMSAVEYDKVHDEEFAKL
jgi:hypothetical protein